MLNNSLNYDINSAARRLIFSAQNLDLSNVEYTKDDIKMSAIKTRSTEKGGFENNVYFREGVKGEYVSIGLSNENLSRLQKSFANTNIKKESNGDIILSGEAEKFVSAWFNDIAYKRGYISADANNDGSLNLGEKYNTTAFFGNSVTQIGNTIFGSHYMTYARNSDFDNANEPISSTILNSIEEELNRTLQLDEDMDGRIYFGDVASSKDILNFFKKIMKGTPKHVGQKSQGLPSPEIIFSFLALTMKSLKEMLKERLKEHLEQIMQSHTTDLNVSVKDIFEAMMSQENGAEILNAIKEQLESNVNSNEAQENSSFFDNEINEVLFNEIAKLTKLDKQTLAYNLENNTNFEENIISIVQELTQNVDALYASKNVKLAHLSQKALDIKA